MALRLEGVDSDSDEEVVAEKQDFGAKGGFLFR